MGTPLAPAAPVPIALAFAVFPPPPPPPLPPLVQDLQNQPNLFQMDQQLHPQGSN